jgi:hypothetical protein
MRCFMVHSGTLLKQNNVLSLHAAGILERNQLIWSPGAAFNNNARDRKGATQMKRSILLLGIVLAACGPATPAIVRPEFLSTPTPYLDETYPTAQVSIKSPDQSASGIDVHVEKAWVDGKNVNANICFTLPDASDWSIYSASLNYSGITLQEYGTTLLSVQESADGQAGSRCDTLTFVVPPDADLTSATIVIDSVGATPREGEYCSVYMPKIQQSLMERGIGIVLDCPDVNGTQTMQIVTFPPEMSQEQAEQVVYSD